MIIIVQTMFEVMSGFDLSTGRRLLNAH